MVILFNFHNPLKLCRPILKECGHLLNLACNLQIDFSKSSFSSMLLQRSNLNHKSTIYNSSFNIDFSTSFHFIVVIVHLYYPILKFMPVNVFCAHFDKCFPTSKLTSETLSP